MHIQCALYEKLLAETEGFMMFVRADVQRITAGILLLALAGAAFAHNVSKEDLELLAGRSGFQPLLFVWLGAKHMVTGYDHLLFLVGVIFYLKSLREIALYVSVFAIGHSITLIGGVLAGFDVNPYIIDAIIGLSVAYKGFDNLNGFRSRTVS